MDIINCRRSIRRYLEKPVEDEKIERLLRAGMQAPSGKNEMPWEFIVVKDKETRFAISQMSEYAGMCRYAPVVIVTLANLEKLADGGAWWIQDMSACTQNILLQAAYEGLGACWCGFYPLQERIDKMRRFYDLPESIVPFSLIPVGYSERENKFIDRFDCSRIHNERY